GLLVVADGAQNDGRLLGRHRQLLQNGRHQHRAGEGVASPSHHVADVVDVAGDGRQLRLPARVAQAYDDVVGNLSHQAAVAFAVLGETDGGQVVVGRPDIGANPGVRPYHL